MKLLASEGVAVETCVLCFGQTT